MAEPIFEVTQETDGGYCAECLTLDIFTQATPGMNCAPTSANHFEANWYQGPYTMTRKYSLVIEGDPTAYSAYVPELPTILVTSRSLEEQTTRATDAIRLYRESVRTAEALD